MLAAVVLLLVAAVEEEVEEDNKDAGAAPDIAKGLLSWAAAVTAD